MADHYDQLPKRLAGRIAIDDEDCWIWTGAKAGADYGHVRIDGRDHYVHRLVYELFVGPIPNGQEIDHLCCIKACCNPMHLEAVTRSENILRGPQPELVRARHARYRALGRCRHGHDLTDPQNVYRYGNDRWQCAVCRRERYIPAAKARAAARR